MSRIDQALKAQDTDMVEVIPDPKAIKTFLHACLAMQNKGVEPDDVIISLIATVSIVMDQRFSHLPRERRLEILAHMFKGFREERLQ